MDLQGKLEVLEPAMLLQVFALAGLSGELQILIPGNSAKLYFQNGALIYGTLDSRPKRIGQFLVEAGHITEAQLDEALAIYYRQREHRRLGRILMDLGYLTYDELVVAVTEQVREVVYQLLSWKQGHFLFFANRVPTGEDILLDDRIEYLLLEGMRRIDEDNAQG